MNSCITDLQRNKHFRVSPRFVLLLSAALTFEKMIERPIQHISETQPIWHRARCYNLFVSNKEFEKGDGPRIMFARAVLLSPRRS